jgi:GT2 family glycosyltransferase
VTNDLTANGQNLLFTPNAHLVTYRDRNELRAVIERYLQNDSERERIAAEGMRHAHAYHTYARRMGDLVSAVLDGGELERLYPVEHRTQVTGDQRVMSRRHAERPEGEQPAAIEGGTGRPTISIIIPAFNQIALTQQCVASIRGSTDIPYEIVLVDNGSTDGTAAWARSQGLRVVENATNLGFPRACNQGLLTARGEYLVLLNNDTVVPPGWLEGLLRPLQADPKTGLVGPSTNYGGGCQMIPAHYASRDEFLHFAEQIADEHAGQAETVPNLIGLCLLIPEYVVRCVGLLDERFGPGNFEDNDYCLRVRMAGFTLRWAKDVFIHHEGSQSFRQLKESYQSILEKNEALFREKWHLARYFEGTGKAPEPANGTTRREDDQRSQQCAAAWALLRDERYSQAYDAFERIAREIPDARVLIGLGLAAEGRGSREAAALAYRTALRIAPGDPDASRLLVAATAGPGAQA